MKSNLSILFVIPGCIMLGAALNREFGHRPKPSPDPVRVAMAESLATARAEARRNLEGWQEALRVAPPDTVVRWATRYVRRHDTAWRDTGSTRTVEVVRWLASSDSAQRVRGDSLEGVASVQAYDLSVCLERLEDAEKPRGWLAFGAGFASGLVTGLAGCVVGD